MLLELLQVVPCEGVVEILLRGDILAVMGGFYVNDGSEGFQLVALDHFVVRD